jgi:glyoxylase-like metal-dependent hydrolase (beta-lactamase superfamily II)
MLVVRNTVVGPFASNCVLAACSRTGEAVLVDPGGDVARALGMLSPEGFRVTRIFCTHGHVDHVAGGAEARNVTGAPLTIHLADRTWVESLPRQAEAFGFDPVPPVTVDRFHEDGETFRVGEIEARVIHTPGHTAGSCCLLLPAEKVVFTGDTLFSGSIGRTDLPGGDLERILASIRERLFGLGDEVRFHPGHGPGGTIGEERRNNPFVRNGVRHGRFV